MTRGLLSRLFVDARAFQALRLRPLARVPRYAGRRDNVSMLRDAISGVLICLGVCAVGLIVAAPAFATSCENAQYRTGSSSALPDCRAYELVSAPGSEPFFETFGAVNGTNILLGVGILGETRGVEASANNSDSSGDARMSYYSTRAAEDAPNDGAAYVATRTPSGWSAEDVIPPQSTASGDLCYNAYIAAYTPELSGRILADGWGQPQSEEGVRRGCGHDEPRLVAGEPLGFQNLFLQTDAASYQLVNITPPESAPNSAWFQAASQDLGHVVFEENAKLTTEAPSGNNLYEWSGNAVRLVTILPNGVPVTGTLVDHHETRCLSCASGTFEHAVSADGSRVLFEAGGNLYLRINADRDQSPLDGGGVCTDPAKACTVQIDISQGPDPSGSGRFMWANTETNRIFFGDENRLTPDSTATPGHLDLYEYSLISGHLTDLTVDAKEPADVVAVSGASDDGSYVYFVARGIVGAGLENSEGATAQAGQPNLYVDNEGTIGFIASLDATEDYCDWDSRCDTARVSPSGAYLGFNSVSSLTGYDSRPAQSLDCGNGESTPAGCQEIFLYNALQKKLLCVSCNPTGARPVAPAGIHPPETLAQVGIEDTAPTYLQRNVLDNGRVFFDTTEPLLPAASNGRSNVYEYESGQLYLISSPTGDGSYFFDSSLSGNDVFFVTGQHLLPQDSSAASVYDARVGGGFPESDAPATSCGEEACRGAFSAVPSIPPPTSAIAMGPENPTPQQSTAKTKPKPKKSKPKCKKRSKKRRHQCARSKRKAKNAGNARTRESAR